MFIFVNFCAYFLVLFFFLQVYKIECSSTGGRTLKKYFVSVVVMERIQGLYLNEFVRHYLEEGVDHFYIHNAKDYSRTYSELACVDNTYFTVLPTLGTTNTAHLRSLIYDMVRNESKWIIMVDSDDFMGSRANPSDTLRSVLEVGALAEKCEIVAVPTLTFIVNDAQRASINKVRSSFVHREGYDESRAIVPRETAALPVGLYSAASKSAGEKKFSSAQLSRYNAARNRMIYKTSAVKALSGLSGQARKSSKRHRICVSSVQRTLSCVGKTVAAIYPRLPAEVVRDKTVAQLVANSSLSLLPLPKYCPRFNKYRARHSDQYTHLEEADVEYLSLANHRYELLQQPSASSAFSASSAALGGKPSSSHPTKPAQRGLRAESTAVAAVALKSPSRILTSKTYPQDAVRDTQTQTHTRAAAAAAAEVAVAGLHMDVVDAYMHVRHASRVINEFQLLANVAMKDCSYGEFVSWPLSSSSTTPASAESSSSSSSASLFVGNSLSAPVGFTGGAAGKRREEVNEEEGVVSVSSVDFFAATLPLRLQLQREEDEKQAKIQFQRNQEAEAAVKSFATQNSRYPGQKKDSKIAQHESEQNTTQVYLLAMLAIVGIMVLFFCALFISRFKYK
jgi:hypothetical protein